MIVFEKHGDIFDTTLQSLVCPVNTVGTMGNGLALAFKQRYEGLDYYYKKACRAGLFASKGFVVWDTPENQKVILLPSKQHWSNPSKIEWIDRALLAIAENYAEYDIESMAIPAVGCGKGQLEWEDVRKLIYEHFGEHHPLQVGIYAPSGE